MNISVDEIERARAQWRFIGSERPDFADVPEPGQESVWDYPRPPKVAPDRRRVEVFADGVTLAASEQAIRVLETASPPTFYIPQSDVRQELLIPASGQSMCEWKGRAVYWSLRMGNVTVKNVAWSYPQPFDGFEDIAGFLAFYPAKLECRVLGIEAKSQPGGLYGGWVTPELAGPFKGAPGTEWW